MTKVKYDVRNVESGVFEQPKPGLYQCKIEACDAGNSKAGNPQLACQFRVATGEHKGSLLWHYVPTDPEAAGYFRMAEFIKAVGLKLSGGFETDDVVGKIVQVRVKPDTYNGEYRARVGSVLPPGEVEEDDEDLDDGDDGAEAPRARRRRRPEPEEDDEEGTEPDDEPAATAPDDDDDDEGDDYDEWEVAELKNELKERGLRTAGNKAALIKRLRTDDEDEEDPFA